MARADLRKARLITSAPYLHTGIAQRLLCAARLAGTFEHDVFRMNADQLYLPAYENGMNIADLMDLLAKMIDRLD